MQHHQVRLGEASCRQRFERHPSLVRSTIPGPGFAEERAATLLVWRCKMVYANYLSLTYHSMALFGLGFCWLGPGLEKRCLD